ncbi:helix-hairpin-helix domain-containing protein [Roseivirga sp. BDSF3-8]|uniref:helix-hairpin-helix domain-containing protein n=1 Tax=Roseivirga sp. BDSF3-8 TaxID=3241598 RepID=UPI0035321386
MDNRDIIRIFKKTAALMELHNENPFKTRTMANASFKLEKLSDRLEDLSRDQLESIEGIGKSLAANIREIADTCTLAYYKDLLAQTPVGVAEMLELKGIGPKKIRTLWKELDVETIPALLQACEDHKVAALKGFGKKTEESLKQNLLFKMANANKRHYAVALPLATEIIKLLEDSAPKAVVSFTGELRRKLDIIEKVDILVGAEQTSELMQALDESELVIKDEFRSGPFSWRGKFEDGLPLEVVVCPPEKFSRQLWLTTGSTLHLASVISDGRSLAELVDGKMIGSEQEAYEIAGLKYVEPEMREGLFEIPLAKEGKLPKLITEKDLKGILHVHSTYSDGRHSLREMAEYCRELGYEYLGITDHSRSAFYANGLDVERIKEQHEEIDALNTEMAPFRIFKGIESDILSDGSLDYEDEVLASFDFIVASIHGNLSMDIDKATQRLIGAIKNPYTTMLGHPTGRLLLRREGYPIDHRAVIDACAEHGVIIEINSNPWRLDIDWRWVHYAIEKGVALSINPDAHEKDGYEDMYWGICTGRKGGLTAEKTFNALSADDVAAHFDSRKKA